MIGRLQALETDLRDSLEYLESCGTCAPTHETSECGVCNHNGHDPKRTPDLVAGLAKATPAELWEIEDAAERAVPAVKF